MCSWFNQMIQLICCNCNILIKRKGAFPYKHVHTKKKHGNRLVFNDYNLKIRLITSIPQFLLFEQLFTCTRKSATVANRYASDKSHWSMYKNI